MADIFPPRKTLTVFLENKIKILPLFLQQLASGVLELGF